MRRNGCVIMLWRCKECGEEAQTKDNKPPPPKKKFKNYDHICKEWEEDKREPHSVLPPWEQIDIKIELGEELSDEEAKKIEEKLKEKRIKKLKKGNIL